MPESTGSWATYVPVTINIDAVEGVHDVFLVGAGSYGVLNLQWFELSDQWAIVLSTEYKVDDDATKSVDVQCTYESLLSAFTSQVYPHMPSAGTSASQVFLQYLGVSTAAEGSTKVKNLCAAAQQTAKTA